ncbi:kinetochore-associated protein NSL1 homolog isoform X2 [Petromyzon marinus]|uniref:Kinetochore-associated protein NSL1 homolog isoform X2 n=1 Tax=Petromyzon marinus TaxID=7757 RepID=A0AAJ7X3X4_PETMA|nr:kinetochore-associated protein NSL1 homolog isoform X2 [Petromyzon marinus]
MESRIPLCSRSAAEVAARRVAAAIDELLARSLSDERRAIASELIVATIVRGLQENVTINGKLWHEIPEVEDPLQDMDMASLDKTRNNYITTVAGKRRRYPKRILNHFVRELKAERECLKLYHPYLPKSLKKECNTDDAKHKELSERVTCLATETSAVMKLLPSMLTKVDNLCKAVESTNGMATGGTNAIVHSPSVEVTPVGEAHAGLQLPGTPLKVSAERHSLLRPRAQPDEQRRVTLRRRLAVDMSPE